MVQKNEVVPENTKRRTYSSYVSSRKWVDSSRLTYELYAELDERNGLANKLLNRLSSDRFDKWFEVFTDSESVRMQIEKVENANKNKGGFDIKRIMKNGRRSAMKYGHSVIFFHYIDSAESVSEPVTNPVDIVQLQIIEAPDVKDIEINMDRDSEYYGEIEYYIVQTKDNYTTTEVRIHASRCINIVQGDTTDVRGLSKLKTMYNWLNIFDNIAWSVGQSFYRYAGGFPVLKIKDYEGMDDTDKDTAKNQWAQVNSMNGFVISDEDEIEFKGAEGRALSPKEYFEAGLGLVAISGDIPYALILGINAGAVSGSETNLKDYYSDVSSKQSLEDQPIIEDIYDKFVKVGRISDDNFKIVWRPLFEQTQKEIAETEKARAEALKTYREAGVYPKEVQDQIDSGELIVIETTESSPVIDSLKKTKNSFIKDGLIVKSTPKQKSRFNSKKFKTLENKYVKEVMAVFNKLKRQAIELIVPFYNDSVQNLLVDDFKKSYGKINSNLDKIFKQTSLLFDPITGEFIPEAFTEGYLSAENQSGGSISGTKGVQAQTLLVTNHLKILKTVASDINKELAVTISNWGLNPPKDIKGIRESINKAFTSKEGRIKMGIIHETNSALNQGYLQAGKNDKMFVAKQWISVLDDVTTPECTTLDGEIVAIGEPFSTGDYAPPSTGRPHPCRSSIELLTAEEAASKGFTL